jgi:acyl carrier protein
MTFERVTKIIAENCDMEESKINRDTTLEELGFDQIETMELIMSIEDEFGISINAEREIKTIADLIALIDESK